MEFCVEIQLLTLKHNVATADWEIKYNLGKQSARLNIFMINL